MTALVLLVLFAMLAYASSKKRDAELSPIPLKVSERLSGLWEIAHHGMRENRFIRAEKALLTILNIDKKNAAAYNRLGILYAKQKEFKDAIDCFEIASSIEPSASSLHNLGLIYYETENYEKASTAFEQALKLEEDMAARHIAFAKVQEKLGNHKMLISSLERAVELEPNKESISLLYQAYISTGLVDKAKMLEKKLSKHRETKGIKAKITRPKRIVV
ncbi:MAG: tetratricopeptide repeat protein [Candidatus Saccharibacteria bacterium]|jgi:tetratricopeptide (TPR) repeat protein|nr:tetratricopeptide repeat protein [Candidatus Saccharibacteria bacterium]